MGVLLERDCGKWRGHLLLMSQLVGFLVRSRCSFFSLLPLAFASSRILSCLGMCSLLRTLCMYPPLS